MKPMNKKGVMQELGNLGVGIAYLVIVLAIVFLILANIRANTTVTADPNASSAVLQLTNAAATIPGWVPLIILIAIGGLMLYMVRRFAQ